MATIVKEKRTQGAFIASTIGDALGWPNEERSGNQNKQRDSNNRFVSWTRKSKDPFWHIETIKAGEYSDDTQLMLAVGRSLLTSDWKKHFTKKEYPFWLNYERGAGRAVLKAASLWGKGEKPWDIASSRKEYFMAGGNGGAMRILPHVIKNLEKGIDSVLDEVIDDVLLSHGHPRAILGATCYAYALHYLFTKNDILSFAELVNSLIDGRKKWGGVPNRMLFADWLNVAQEFAGYVFSEEWNNCYLRMLKELKYINQALADGILSDDKSVLENLGAFAKTSGAGDVSVLSAVYFFSKYVNSPALAISIPANMIGIDTDTIASMTGGLIGAFHGTDWIPLEWKNVQDYSYICNLSDKLYRSRKENDESADTCASDDFKQLQEIRCDLIESKYSVLRVCEYKTSFGQTIYIKTYDKRSEVKVEKKRLPNKMNVCINQTLAEKVIKDDVLSRVTLRKAMEVVWLRHRGIDEKNIVKQTKLTEDVVERIIESFF